MPSEVQKRHELIKAFYALWISVCYGVSLDPPFLILQFLEPVCQFVISVLQF